MRERQKEVMAGESGSQGGVPFGAAQPPMPMSFDFSPPLRTCIGCRGKAPQEELIRIKRITPSLADDSCELESAQVEIELKGSFLVDYLLIESSEDRATYGAIGAHQTAPAISWRRKRFSSQKGRSVYLHPCRECVQAACLPKRLKGPFRASVSQKECELLVSQCEEILLTLQKLERANKNQFV